MAATYLASPSTAVGSTALLRPTTVGLAGTAELTYTAAPGEQNRTFFRPPSTGDFAWVVTDAGAVIVPGDACESIDPHTVRCGMLAVGGQPPQTAMAANARLEDLDDEVSLLPAADFSSWSLVADGGAGNDRLRGGSGQDLLDGGAEQDQLLGEGGADTFLDPASEGGAGRDSFDGGVGEDTISYEARSRSVTVDLAARRGGEAGEADSLAHLESVIGGRGDDRVAGNGLDNRLDGGGGRNRLTGRGGLDSFENANGPIACGTGSDSVRNPSVHDILEPDCDWVEFGDDHILRANPVIHGRSLTYRPDCPSSEDGPEYEVCSGTLVLRETGGKRRLVARKRFRERRWDGQRITARLTPAGRRLTSRRLGVRASFSILDRRWSIRLVARRPRR